MTTVIIPAAGLATRLRPISNFTSKSMVPVNGKPAISYIIDQIKDWATDIRIVIGKTNDIEQYCERAYPELPIRYFKQEDPKGPLHAIYCGLVSTDDVTDDDLIVWLGDTIVLDYVHTDTLTDQCSVVYHKVPDWDRWCLIGNDGALYDKPKNDPGTDKALVGIYVFSSLSLVYKIVTDIIMYDEPSVKNEYQISQLLDPYPNKKQIETNEWYDCGDFPSLYESRAKLLNRLSRDDNSLSVDTIRGTITKSGKRCRDEIEWYKSRPKSIQPFVPTIYDITTDSYTMEYCPGTSLQDILVFENIKEDTIHYTLDRILQIFELSFIENANIRSNESSIYMWINKNLDRFNKYNYNFIQESDLQLIKSMVKSDSLYNLIKQNQFVDIIHGDLHFGNILFDYNTGKVKFIDPRGNWNNVTTNNGDLEYDIAKMYQSCFCEYIWIINDLTVNQDLKFILVNKLDEFFSSKGFEIYKLKLLSIIMMASCLPFHNDDPKRQERIWNTSIKKLKEIDISYE